MSTHAACPNCFNKTKGTGIYKCNGCGTIFCTRCAGHIGLVYCKCPKCQKTSGEIGKIG